MNPLGPVFGRGFRHFRDLLPIIVAPLLLAGCATGPTYSEIGSSLPAVNPNVGRVFVYRPVAFVASGLRPVITVNGQVVGRSVTGGFFYADIAPGNYDLVAMGEMGNGDGRTAFSVSAGREVFIKISYGFTSFNAEVVDPGVGEADLGSLKFDGGLGRGEVASSRGKLPSPEGIQAPEDETGKTAFAGVRRGGETGAGGKMANAQNRDYAAYANHRGTSMKTGAAQQKVPRSSEGTEQTEASGSNPAQSGQRATTSDTMSSGSGLYSLDSSVDFNVLDDVVLNPATGRITLVGHRDPAYGGAPIPYLEHLAELLDNPSPAFSLNWAPESQPRVDELFRNFGSPDYVRGLVSQWSQVMGPDGHPTGSGRWVLPYLGIKPTDNGQRLGYLGTSVQESENKLAILAVEPGSPADQAGLRPGDAIYNYANAFEFTHTVHLLGEGGQVMLQIERDGTVGAPMNITLGGVSDDPWAELDKYDMIAKMLSAIGNNQGAALVSSFGGLQRILTGTQAGGQTALLILISIAGYNDSHMQDLADFQAGRISNDEVLDRTFRTILAAMEKAFEINDGAGTAAYNNARTGGSAPPDAYDQAVPVMNARMEPYLVQMTETLLGRSDEIMVPPEEMALTVGPQVEVTPEFRGLDPQSSVAHTLYSADYLGKSLINMPSLAQKIPRYESAFAFERNHPESAGEWSDSGQYHLWFSIGSLDLAESQDGNTLRTRGATMRINIRQEGQGDSSTPPNPGYEGLLNSLYDDFAREFPVLHELTETAKVAGAAMWLREKRPDLRLPARGRALWSVPERVPGALYMTFSPRERPGRLAAALSAMGGVDLNARRVIAILPKDSSIPEVDLSGGAAAPEGGDPALISRALQLPDGLPLPQPIGWVTQGTENGQTETSVTFDPGNDLRDAPASVRVQQNQDDNARVLWKSGDLDGAIESLTEKLQGETDPQARAGLMIMLAQILHEKGDDDDAIRTLNQAHAVDPANPNFLLVFGMLRSEMGDTQGAIEALQKYVSRAPSNKAAAALLAELKGGGSQSAPSGGPGAAVPAAAPGRLTPFTGSLAFTANQVSGPAEELKANAELRDWTLAQYQANGLAPAPSIPPGLAKTWQEYFAKKSGLQEESRNVDSDLKDVRARLAGGEGDPAQLQVKEAALTAKQADITKQVEAADKKMKADIVKWNEENPNEPAGAPSQAPPPQKGQPPSGASVKPTPP